MSKYYEPNFSHKGNFPAGTLCEFCHNAVPGAKCGCSWSESFKPVDGWEAIPTHIKGKDEDGEYTYESYCVIRCPQFNEEPHRDGYDQFYKRLKEDN